MSEAIILDRFEYKLPKENFSICFENKFDIDDYVDSILCSS